LQVKIQIAFKLQVKNREKFDFRSSCPISSALDILGDKWSLLIIRDICLLGKRTYTDFADSEEKIASNILADRLSKLESHGIITRHKMTENKKTNIYTITAKGIDLLPVLVEIILWSDKYLKIDPKARQFAKSIQQDKQGVIRALAEGLKKTI